MTVRDARESFLKERKPCGFRAAMTALPKQKGVRQMPDAFLLG